MIIGAGPAGLATGYWLTRYQIPFCILEKDQIGSSWVHHYDSLSLHTLKEVSALPGFPPPDDYPKFMPRRLVADYLKSYARRFKLPVVEQTKVEAARYISSANRWCIMSEQKAYYAEILIVSTGIWSTPNRPAFLGEKTFPGPIVHAQAYKNNDPFRNKRVLVIGGGNSGSEIAVEISQVARETTVAIRDGTTFAPYPRSWRASVFMAWLLRTIPAVVGHKVLQWSRPDFSELNLPPPDGFLTEAYPVIGLELPAAVKAGRVKAIASEIKGIHRETVVFKDGSCGSFEAIVLATGYRPTLNFLEKGAMILDKNGWPKLASSGQSAGQPDLFGIGFTYPNTEGWLQSIPRFSKRTAQGVRRRLQRRSVQMAERPPKPLSDGEDNQAGKYGKRPAEQHGKNEE